MRLLLIRHGETLGNKGKKLIGHTDFPLTEEGKKQIEKIREQIKDENIDAVFTSPMTRTLDTAKILTKNLDVEIRFREEIKELNFGIFEGKDMDEISKDYPDEWNRWINDYRNYRIPNGESLIDIFQRVKGFMDKIKDTDKTYLVVTHGGAIQIMIIYLLNLGLHKMWHFHTPPGCLVEIEYNGGFGVMKKLIY